MAEHSKHPAHPWVQLAVGRRGAGKTYWSIHEVARFRGEVVAGRVDVGGRELIYAVDGVATQPPALHHLASMADAYDPEVPAELPPEFCLIAVDEADEHAPQGEARRRPPPPLIDLLRRGRHRGVSLLLATQRPANLVYDAWGLADRIVICQLTSKRDLDRVCELEGVAQYRAHIASHTTPGPAVIWTPYGVDVCR